MSEINKVIAELVRERDEAKKPRLCNVCCGRPLPSGKDCICCGKGTELAEMDGLRLALIAAENKLAPSPCPQKHPMMFWEVHDVQEGYCNTCSAEWEPGYCGGRCTLCAEQDRIRALALRAVEIAEKI